MNEIQYNALLHTLVLPANVVETIGPQTIPLILIRGGENPRVLITGTEPQKKGTKHAGRSPREWRWTDFQRQDGTYRFVLNAQIDLATFIDGIGSLGKYSIACEKVGEHAFAFTSATEIIDTSEYTLARKAYFKS